MISVIGIYIQGLKDGEYTIHETCNAEDVNEMPPEYKGTLNVNGKLRKHINRYLIDAEIDVTAYLQCDLSLEEYQENIRTSFHATYIIGVSSDNGDEHNNIFVIGDDTKEIALDYVIREELLLALPLKRISPQWRNKDWQQPIQEEIKENEPLPSDTWAVLKNLQSNTLNN